MNDKPLQLLADGMLGRLAKWLRLLGYDTAFTDTARRLTRGGAQLLTLSTHDWTLMTAAYGAHTRLRAVENGVPVVKADWETGSMIVDPQGQVLAAAPMDRTAEVVLVADVPLGRPGGTPFTCLGDVLGYICLGGMVLFLAVGRFGLLEKIMPQQVPPRSNLHTR